MFFDSDTASSIADPETYDRSDNGKADVHIDHTSLPEGPNTSFVAGGPTIGMPNRVAPSDLCTFGKSCVNGVMFFCMECDLLVVFFPCFVSWLSFVLRYI